MATGTEASKYPKRGNHFAHRFTRLLTKTAVAQELGPQVCFLLTVIAHQEDAKRYSGAVTFWNEQLMPLVGTAKWRTLDRFRKVAVEAGWLHYENRGKRKPGVYWVLIPGWAEPLTDAPVDEGISPQMDHKGGDNGGHKGGYKGGDNDGHKRGHSSTLTLSPTPDPIPEEPPTPSRGQGGDTRISQCERIYHAYPKKVGKADALKAIDTALKRPPGHRFHVTAEDLLAAVQDFAKAVHGADMQYIPGPATWIRKTRWCDEREDWKRLGRSDKRNQQPGLEGKTQQFTAW